MGNWREGEVVVVSGAGRGIGAAVARELGRRGMRVIVNYRSDRAAADLVAAAITESGGEARAVAADVTDAEQVATLLRATIDTFGAVHVLVCNANTVQPRFETIEDLAWEDTRDKVIGELAGAFHLTQQALPLLLRQQGGSIVYISSTAADYVGPGRLAHGTAKAALSTFAGHVAAYAARWGITVTTVAPGAVRTDATAAVLTDEQAQSLAAHSALAGSPSPKTWHGSSASLSIRHSHWLPAPSSAPTVGIDCLSVLPARRIERRSGSDQRW